MRELVRGLEVRALRAALLDLEKARRAGFSDQKTSETHKIHLKMHKTA